MAGWEVTSLGLAAGSPSPPSPACDCSDSDDVLDVLSLLLIDVIDARTPTAVYGGLDRRRVG